MRRSTRQQRMGQGGDVLEREAVRAVWGPQTLVWADSDLMGTSRKAPATQSCCGRSLSPPPPQGWLPEPPLASWPCRGHQVLSAGSRETHAAAPCAPHISSSPGVSSYLSYPDLWSHKT